MFTRKLSGFFATVLLVLCACESVPRQIVTMEVTRVVRDPQIVTAEVTRVVRETHVVTSQVTRIVRETVVVIAAPPHVSQVNVTQGKALLDSRAIHSATILKDGRILLVGGSRAPDDHLASVEIFNLATGKSSIAAPLHTSRHGHSATLLRDGRVLVVGGYTLPQQWLDDAEVYDPAANSWTVIRPNYSHGGGHSATVMKDGRVLVAGGCIGNGVCTERVEIFDPKTNSWSDTSPLPSDRANQAALLLNNGQVLAVGGWSSAGTPAGGDALLYDPLAKTWKATGRMVTPRVFAQSVRFPNGRVLAVGGVALKNLSSLSLLASAEIYDPASNTWRAASGLSQKRYLFNLALLPNGQVLAVGGARDWDCCWSAGSFVSEIESYDLKADRWHTVGELAQPEAQSAAVLLPDGRLWVTGGRAKDSQGSYTYWSDTWLIGP